MKTLKDMKSARTQFYKDDECEDGSTFEEINVWVSELRQSAIEEVKLLKAEKGEFMFNNFKEQTMLGFAWDRKDTDNWLLRRN